MLLGWPLLTNADLASDTLVLPLLQSLAAADCHTSRAAVLALLARTTPSTKALLSLHNQLQVRSLQTALHLLAHYVLACNNWG